MIEYSEQDLKYAAEFREEIHKEALAIVRKTRPDVSEVIDRHPVEDYFQENRDYPGKWYTVVAIPYGYKSRKALVDRIVSDTLSGTVLEKERTHARELQSTVKEDTGIKRSPDQLDSKPDGYEELFAAERKNGSFRAVGVDSDGRDILERFEEYGAGAASFYALIEEYPDLVVDYRIVKGERYSGLESHSKALKIAFADLCAGWGGDPDRAVGKKISEEEQFSSNYPEGKLNYRKAFLYPPHKHGYTGKDFVRVNEALFPNGTDGLEVYEWTTDWSEYFDDGNEWWGSLCLTFYDKTLDRFAVVMASATD